MLVDDPDQGTSNKDYSLVIKENATLKNENQVVGKHIVFSRTIL